MRKVWIFDLLRQSKGHDGGFFRVPGDVTSWYLAEDCVGYNRGRRIDEAVLDRLINSGAFILWIQDNASTVPESEPPEKSSDFQDYFKRIVDQIVNRSWMPLDESKARKDGSSVALMVGDSITRVVPTSLEMDGARILFREAFGLNGCRIHGLWKAVHRAMSGLPDRVTLGDNLTYAVRATADNSATSALDLPNFAFKTSLSTGIIFSRLLKSICDERVKNGASEILDHNIKIGKRYLWRKKSVIDAALSSFFTDYGYMHSTTLGILQRLNYRLVSLTGEIHKGGVLPISPEYTKLLARHCHVIANLFSAPRDPEFVGAEITDMLRFQHQALHGSGYPARVSSRGKSVQQKEAIWTVHLSELTRALNIVNTFVEYLYGTPWRLPVSRHSLVEYFIARSGFPLNDKGEEDASGDVDFDTRLSIPYRFDGYLVMHMLNVVSLYRIGEEAPLYKGGHLVGIAEITAFGILPHRPHINVKSEKEEYTLNLSEKSCEAYRLGEYHPTLDLRCVQTTKDSAIDNAIFSDGLSHLGLASSLSASDPAAGEALWPYCPNEDRPAEEVSDNLKSRGRK